MKTYNKIYTVHAWKDNNKFFTVTQGEGGIKYPRLMVVDDKGAIDLTGSAVTYTITLPRGAILLVVTQLSASLLLATVKSANLSLVIVDCVMLFPFINNVSP